MSIQRIASRYAKSIIDLSQDSNSLEEVVNDMRHFIEVCTVRDFRLLLKSPIVNATAKKGVFVRLFKDSYTEMSMAFFEIILRKGREMYLEEIAKEIVQQYRIIKGIAAVSLTTAAALEANQLDEIKNTISASDASYKNVELSTNLDPSILGGFILEFEDKLYDASVSHRLDQLRKEFS